MNVKQSVPFFMVTDMQASLRFYVDGLGFTQTIEWTPARQPRVVLARARRRRAHAAGVSSRTSSRCRARASASRCVLCATTRSRCIGRRRRKGLKTEKKPFVGNNLVGRSLQGSRRLRYLFREPNQRARGKHSSGTAAPSTPGTLAPFPVYTERMRTFTSAALLVLAIGCSKPAPPPPPPAGPAEDLITAESLVNHLKVLASDEFEGRAPATPGGEKTAGLPGEAAERAWRRTRCA